MENNKLATVFSNYQGLNTFKFLLFKFFKIQNVKMNPHLQFKILTGKYTDDKSFYLSIKNLNQNIETDEYNDHEKYSYVVRNYSKFLRTYNSNSY